MSALTALLICSQVALSPPDIYGFGARGMGMAGAMVGAVDDSSANFYNPAALTRRSELQLDIGYLVTSTSLKLNGKDVGVDEGSGFQLGVVVPGEFGPIGLAFGVGLFLPQDRISRVRALPQQQPRFVYYDNRPQRVYVTTNLAIRVLPWLHLGGGIAFLTETAGSLDLSGLVWIGDTERTTLNASIDVRFETVRYPTGAILFTPDDSWSVGVTYREQVAAQLDLGATVDGAIPLSEDNLAPGSFAISSFNTTLFTPRQLWVGGTYAPVDELLISMDVGWLNWSAYPTPTANLTTSIDIEGLDLAALLPPPQEVFAPNFHDIVSGRFALEGRFQLGSKVQLDARLGYAYEPTPAPDQPALTNYVDTDKHTIGTGISVTITAWSPHVAAPLSIDLGGQAILLAPRQYKKADPNDPIGDFEASGHLLTFNGTIRWCF